MYERKHEEEVDKFLDGVYDSTGNPTGILNFDDTFREEKVFGMREISHTIDELIKEKLMELKKEHDLNDLDSELLFQMLGENVRTLPWRDTRFEKEFFGHNSEITDVMLTEVKGAEIE